MPRMSGTIFNRQDLAYFHFGFRSEPPQQVFQQGLNSQEFRLTFERENLHPPYFFVLVSQFVITLYAHDM